MAKKKIDIKIVEVPDKTVSPVTKREIELPVSAPTRRSVRYNIARIMHGNYDGDGSFISMIEEQFVDDMRWDNFMKEWDIDKNDPYLVVSVN